MGGGDLPSGAICERFSDLRRRNIAEIAVIAGYLKFKVAPGGSGKPPPPPLGYPPVAIVLHYQYSELFPVQVIPTESHTPPPSIGRQGWREGGCKQGD